MFSEHQQKIKSHLKSNYLLSDAKVEEVYPQFIETVKSMMTELETICLSGDIEAVSRAGHAIKGALLSLGLPEHAEIALAIEKHHLPQSPNIEVKDLIAQLKQKLS